MPSLICMGSAYDERVKLSVNCLDLRPPFGRKCFGSGKNSAKTFHNFPVVEALISMFVTLFAPSLTETKVVAAAEPAGRHFFLFRFRGPILSAFVLFFTRFGPRTEIGRDGKEGCCKNV